jgi:hypothetical protein
MRKADWLCLDMSLEAGVLVDFDGNPIYWHLPNNRSAGYIPDSHKLWDEIWKNRCNLLGFAHSHPGRGFQCPSQEDITTFSAVEAALGEKLIWWIISEDAVTSIIWVGPHLWDYNNRHENMKCERDPRCKLWLTRLREESRY